MYKWFLATVLSLMKFEMLAQKHFLNLRYNEDYQYLRNDSTLSRYEKLKFNKLNKRNKIFVSQGGEVRYLHQYFKHEDWGDSPVNSYHSFYTRLMYHADWHFSPSLRLFTQLNSTAAFNRVTPNRSIDQNDLNMQQLFLDFTLPKNLTIRWGRQELLYGSQRIISVREGPNNRQSFDAAKIMWKSNQLQIDFFYAHPVLIHLYVFDDRFNKNEKIWSTYLTWEINKRNKIEGYYIGYSNTLKRYNAGINHELRHSVGSRLQFQSENLNYDLEALYQFGTWGTESIQAYTASINVNYTFNEVKTKPGFGIKTEIISGDRNNLDQNLNTFNPLFPRGAYFGLAALIGPVNLIDFHPTIQFQPMSVIEVAVDYDIFWRYSINDGIYGPNVALLYHQNSNSNKIGKQWGLAITYEPNRFLKITCENMVFLPDQYLKEVSSGENVFFSALTIQSKF